ncbi:MAG TPA: hypothetical protein VJ761_19360 [Ktedonobacteraceae bacterium]|nr:hypothetical protein [Ktedonobacteraceae bacterium]
MSELKQEKPTSPSVYSLDGPLPGGRYLASPLTVLIEYDDGEFIVSEPRFHMHASASTKMEALAAFRRVFSGYLDVLTSQEASLGAHMREQLQYLRSAIRPV